MLPACAEGSLSLVHWRHASPKPGISSPQEPPAEVSLLREKDWLHRKDKNLQVTGCPAGERGAWHHNAGYCGKSEDRGSLRRRPSRKDGGQRERGSVRSGRVLSRGD